MIVSVAGRVEQVNLKVGLPVSHEEIKIDSRPTYYTMDILTSIGQSYNAAIWCDKSEPYSVIDC